MSDKDYFIELLDTTNQRLTDLSKSYRVLNDNHQSLEIKMTRLESRIDTTASIVKWLISPVAVVGLLIQVLQVCGVI